MKAICIGLLRIRLGYHYTLINMYRIMNSAGWISDKKFKELNYKHHKIIISDIMAKMFPFVNVERFFDNY